MKVLIVNRSGEVWGAERSMLSIFGCLVGRGNVEAVVCAPSGGLLQERATAAGLGFIELASTRHGDLAGGEEGRAELRRLLAAVSQAPQVARAANTLARMAKDFDLIVSFSQQSHADCVAASRIAKVPVLLDLHDVPRSVSGRVLTRLVVADAEGAVAISDYVASSFWLARHERVDVIPRPIGEIQRVDRSLREPTCDALIVGIVGQVADVKGIREAAEGIRVARALGCDVRLHVVGRGREDLPGGSAEAESILEACRTVLGPGFVYAGFQRDPTNEILRCDVVLNYSAAEPFGRSLIEAQALGVPVVAVAAGGAPETVLDGRTGFVIEGRDPAILGGTLAFIYQRRELLKGMGVAGRVWSHERFGLTHIADRYLESMVKAVSGSRAAG